MIAANKKRWLAQLVFAAFFIGVGVILTLAVFVVWLHAYPDDADPKNVYYVLWKHGLNNNVNLDSALAAMSHDVWPVRQVQGLTKEQPRSRFGYIRALDETTAYLRDCYAIPDSAGREETRGNREDVLFLRDSPWMVVTRNGKAVDLILCKGY
jgi:hypothetical protein